ncbi:hypothetical protein C2W64_04288 [Brevibacillus laterosporus]|nr:hypothetical protein C2W64_04288 [Brevibacillus laterosporus]
MKGCSGKAVFHPTIKTVGFQSAITVIKMVGRSTKKAHSSISKGIALNATIYIFQKDKQINKAS